MRRDDWNTRASQMRRVTRLMLVLLAPVVIIAQGCYAWMELWRDA